MLIEMDMDDFTTICAALSVIIKRTEDDDYASQCCTKTLKVVVDAYSAQAD
jgi:hypothetical protein